MVFQPLDVRKKSGRNRTFCLLMPPESPQSHAARAAVPAEGGGGRSVRGGPDGGGRGERRCTDFPRPPQETRLSVKGAGDRSVNYVNI